MCKHEYIMVAQGVNKFGQEVECMKCTKCENLVIKTTEKSNMWV